MSDFFIGEIRAFGFDFAPKSWALANGATLSVQQNQALFSLLGANYGGNGTTTFQLPDLQGRTPFSWGSGTTSSYAIAAKGGAETVALTSTTMPAHNHIVKVVNEVGTTIAPAGDEIAAIAPDASTPPITPNVYGPLNTPTPLNPATIAATGAGAAHNNMQPFTVLNYCIALAGLYPSRQ